VSILFGRATANVAEQQGNREAHPQPSRSTNAVSGSRSLIEYPICNCPAKSPAASFKRLNPK
jgi:hypothetical protein